MGKRYGSFFLLCGIVFMSLLSCGNAGSSDPVGLLEADRALLNAAAFGYASGDSAVRVTTDVILPLTGTNGSSISWSSTDPEVQIAGATASFSRPGPQEGDVTVNLTATLTNDTAMTTREIPLILHHLPGWRTVAVTEQRGGNVGCPLPMACNAAGELLLAYNSTSYDSGIFVCALVGDTLNPLGGDVNNLEGATAHDLVLDASGNPVLAFQDWSNDYRAVVYRYSGNAWELVGTAGLSTGQAYFNTLASGNGLLYHSCQDMADGKIWVRPGTGPTGRCSAGRPYRPVMPTG